MEKNVTFSYNYSAAENKEVEEIRKKYMPQGENKMDELKRLDNRVQTAGMTISLSIGIIGCLVFGLGMCLGMKVLGDSLILGVVVGIIGMAIMIPAYPVYRHIHRKTKAELTPRILELADELIVH